MRKEVCEDIYKQSMLIYHKKIYDRISLFKEIIQEISQIETITKPQLKLSIKKPTSIEELKASYKNQVQSIIYERISELELDALGEDSKRVQENVISVQMSRLEILKKELQP